MDVEMSKIQEQFSTRTSPYKKKPGSAGPAINQERNWGRGEVSVLNLLTANLSKSLVLKMAGIVPISNDGHI